MQKQVRDKHVVLLRWWLPQPIEDLGRHGFHLPAQAGESLECIRRDRRPSVEQYSPRPSPRFAQTVCDLVKEVSIARAQLDQAVRWVAESYAQYPFHRPRVAHPGIHPPQIPSGPKRQQVLRGEVVEQLGFYSALHLEMTSKRQPSVSRFTFHVSRITHHVSASLHLQQRPVATEAGAKRGEPPGAAGRRVGQRGLENEEDRSAAQVPIILKHGRAPAQVLAL